MSVTVCVAYVRCKLHVICNVDFYMLHMYMLHGYMYMYMYVYPTHRFQFVDMLQFVAMAFFPDLILRTRSSLTGVCQQFSLILEPFFPLFLLLRSL